MTTAKGCATALHAGAADAEGAAGCQVQIARYWPCKACEVCHHPCMMTLVVGVAEAVGLKMAVSTQAPIEPSAAGTDWLLCA